MTKNGVHIGGMTYRAVILDSLSYMPDQAKPFLKKLAMNGRLIVRESFNYATLLKEL